MMINYEKELDDNQLAAVMSNDRRILCVANAGSGKTRTVTYRVARLLEMGVDESQIMMLTFTNKAASEMKNRICKLLDVPNVRIVSGTFHSVGFQYIRQNPYVARIHRNTTIVDASDAKDIMKMVRSKVIAAMSSKKDSDYDNESVDWNHMPNASAIAGVWSYARNTQSDIEDCIENMINCDDMDDDTYGAMPGFIRCVIDAYESEKSIQRCIDFDDVLLMWDHMLDDVSFRQRVYRDTPYIFVDEYQDINAVQASIIRKLAGQDSFLTAVGDDAQCIYGFRGSEIRYIRDFVNEYSGAVVYPISYNYRSLPHVIDLALNVINRSPDYRSSAKRMLPVRKGDVRTRCFSFDTERNQATYIANECKKAMLSGIPCNEIAVLLRNNRQAKMIEMVLRKHDLPVSVECGIGFYDRSHIRKVLHYFRFLFAPANQVAFYSLIDMLPGVGPKTATKFYDQFRDSGYDFNVFADLSYPKKSKDYQNGFTKAMIEGARLMACEGCDTLKSLISLFRTCCLDSWIEITYANDESENERKSRYVDLQLLEDMVTEFHDVADFLTNASLVAEDTDKKVTGIRLMTMHKSKGLEFQKVFLPYMSQGMLPSAKALRGYDESAIEDERRLLYVAVTRAMDELDILYTRCMIGSDKSCSPTMFLDSSLWVDYRMWCYKNNINYNL